MNHVLETASRPAFFSSLLGRGLIDLIISRYPAAAGANGLAMIHLIEPAVAAAHITLNGVSRQETLARGREIVKADTVNPEGASKVDPGSDKHECLRQKIRISNARIEAGDFGRTITLDITNDLAWAISGIHVAYVARSKDRSVPWANEQFSLGISGGIEPGETRTLRTSASLFAQEAPDELITTTKVLDVADPFGRQLLQDVTVIGWAEEKSPMECE